MRKCTCAMVAAAMSLCLSARAYALELSSVSNSADVAIYLRQFPYPGTNIASYAECDFRTRLNAVIAVLRCDCTAASTNALLCVADYLAEGRELPVSNRVADVIAAHRLDRFVTYGDSNFIVRAGMGHWGSAAITCRNRYDLFDTYNLRLSQFKDSVVNELDRLLSSDRWRSLTSHQREALRQEFINRMRVHTN